MGPGRQAQGETQAPLSRLSASAVIPAWCGQTIILAASIPYVRHEEFYQGPDLDLEYVDPGDHVNHFIYLHGLWCNGLEELVHARQTENFEDYIAIKFSTIEANVVLSLGSGQPYHVRVTLDGGPLDPSQAGADIRFYDAGNSFIQVEASNMYHVVQLPEFGSHELRLSSNSSDFAVFAYTFGSYLAEPESPGSAAP